ncbi:MAG: hypothetical protein JWM86_2301 [Thermoleophilia bacterium]|nr:hypothetical protein [Thermoleophilia bacterium]
MSFKLPPLFGPVKVGQGGTARGTLWAKLTGDISLVKLALRTGIVHPSWVKVSYAAQMDAIQAEHDLFQGGRDKQGYDNGSDAYRHAYGEALMSYRLITVAGTTVEQAIDLVAKEGIAHEADSKLTGLHNQYSSAMDMHNNAVGTDIGVRAAISGLQPGPAADTVISDQVLDAIRAGKLMVLDTTTTPPRPSRASDLALPQRDTPAGQEPSGTPSFTPGFDIGR